MTNYEKLKEECPKMLKDIEEWIKHNRNTKIMSVEDQINAETADALLDIWLSWNGIMGYTSSILSLVKCFYKFKEDSACKIASVMAGEES